MRTKWCIKVMLPLDRTAVAQWRASPSIQCPAHKTEVFESQQTTELQSTPFYPQVDCLTYEWLVQASTIQQYPLDWDAVPNRSTNSAFGVNQLERSIGILWIIEPNSQTQSVWTTGIAENKHISSFEVRTAQYYCCSLSTLKHQEPS